LNEEQIKTIVEKVDFDGSLFIDYSEWVVATINKEILLKPSILEYAFNLFDKDGSGEISAEEIKEILSHNKNINMKVWRDIINEVDKDGNGAIDF